MNILGIGRALPDQAVTNGQIAKILDTSDEWIRSRTGIAERRVMADQGLTALAVGACEEALRDAQVRPGQIDWILGATTMGDYVFPSLACLVQRGIGAACPAMDLHAACSGFLYGLDCADALIASGRARRVLLVGAEALSRLTNWQDRATAVLFGDGAAAVVLGPGEGLLSLRLHAQGEDRLLAHRAHPGTCPYTDRPQGDHGLTMQGQEVFRFAVSQSPRDLLEAAEAAGIAIEDVDWVLLHQANRRIIDAVRARLGIPAHRLPSNIHRLGNTSAASIPLLLYELYHSGRLLPGQLLAMSAFGAGLTSGACVFRWTRPAPMAPVPADDIFAQDMP